MTSYFHPPPFEMEYNPLTTTMPQRPPKQQNRTPKRKREIACASGGEIITNNE